MAAAEPGASGPTAEATATIAHQAVRSTMAMAAREADDHTQQMQAYMLQMEHAVAMGDTEAAEFHRGRCARLQAAADTGLVSLETQVVQLASEHADAVVNIASAKLAVEKRQRDGCCSSGSCCASLEVCWPSSPWVWPSSNFWCRRRCSK